MLAVGAVLFKVVVTLDVEVQPFAPVTVTVYTPAVVMLLDAATVEPSLHA